MLPLGLLLPMLCRAVVEETATLSVFVVHRPSNPVLAETVRKPS